MSIRLGSTAASLSRILKQGRRLLPITELVSMNEPEEYRQCGIELRSARKLANNCAPCPKKCVGTLGSEWKQRVMISAVTCSNSETKAIAIGFVSARFVFCSFWRETSFKFMLYKIERKLMSDAAILEKIETLNQAVARHQQRVEDIQDLRDLDAAIADNHVKPLM